MMRITIFFLILAGFYASESSALELPERLAVPGGVAIVEVGKSSDPAPTVRFGKKPVLVMEQSGKWLAVIGLPLSVDSGEQEIRVRNAGVNDWQSISFKVKTNAYPEQRLTIKNKRKVDPNEEDMKRIRRDNAKIARAKQHWSDEIIATRFSLPVSGIRSSAFGLKRFFNDKPRRPHGGLDIAAPEGTPVYAPANGTIIETGDFFFSGNCIFLDHGQGLQTFYAHLSKIDVEPGQAVKKGEKIGEVGETGRVTGAHLHWSVGLNQTWVNPDLFLER